MIHALARTRPGSLELRPVELPSLPVAAGQVRIEIDAAALNPADIKVLHGGFKGAILHGRTDPLVVGYDFCGRVREAGEGSDLEAGTTVYGHLAYANSNRQGTLADEVVVDAQTVARAPAVSVEEAAALPTVALTALQGLRDEGGLGPGGSALVIGASGGVGCAAIGVAKRLGASVTGVCSTYAVQTVRELGADHVIDRKKDDFRARDDRHDVVFDASGLYSYGDLRPLLKPGGRAVTTLPSASFLLGKLGSVFTSTGASWVMVKSRRADLQTIAGWVEDGLRVPVARTFRGAEASAALAALEEGGFIGKIVVTGS